MLSFLLFWLSLCQWNHNKIDRFQWWDNFFLEKGKSPCWEILQMLCLVVDRHWTAVHTCPCVFLYEPTIRQEHGMCTVMGHCVSICTYMHQPLPNFPASHYYYEASHFGCIFCCLLEYYSIHDSVWYIVPMSWWMIKGCKCKVGRWQSWAIVFSVF